jgi:drug/metabolite transporter (DMT)-like permease
MTPHIFGQLAALGTAFCWAITSTYFEAAGRRVGSLQVNLTRMVVAFAIFAMYSVINTGGLLPLNADRHIWIWLSLSGLVGFVFGDLFLFQAFVDLGARRAMLVYSSVPPMTAILGWLILGEVLTATQIAGMVITVLGIVTVVAARPASPSPRPVAVPMSTPQGHYRRGVWFAMLGSLGQAMGLVLSRYGAPTFDAFAATQIRILSGLIGFAVLFTVLRRWHRISVTFRDRTAMNMIARGAFFGPFLGVSLGLFAAQRAGTGIAATLIATVPVILMVTAITVHRERVGVQEGVGILMAVAGVALLFLQ